MAFYVIRPPDPPVGFDWTYEIPGQYLEDIVSVSATLSTQPAGAVTAVDSSGNGFDGTYHGLNNTGWFQPGVVAGDLAILTGQLFTPNRTWISTPQPVVQWVTGWSFAMWLEIPTHSVNQDEVLMVAPDIPVGIIIRVWMEHPLDGSLTVDGTKGTWQTNPGVIPINGTACFVCVTWDGITMTPYIDGVAVAWATTPAAPGTTPPAGPPIAFSLSPIQADSVLLADEWTVWGGAISAGDVASMFAAAAVSFPAYTAAVLATAPATYYHLDDGAIGAGRTPTIAVTDGTDTVGEFPSGFPPASGIGDFSYTWTARQMASAQTANQLVTSLSLPALLLPAGYTIGSVTPGLGALDQWSDIAIWWDSTQMDLRDGLFDYAYAPGFKLEYHYDPSTAGG